MRSDQIAAIARHMQDGYERSARRRLHRSTGHWNNGMALARAVGQAVGEALTDLSQRMEPGEVLVDLAHSERYTVGPRGVRLTLTMLAATNRRLWHVVHRDGAVVTSTPMPTDAVTARRKSLTLSIGVEQSGHGWTVTGNKSLVTWVDNIVHSRPQAPVGLVARVTASSVEQRPSWSADPSGRHELRYWDGMRWTEHVSDHGVTRREPLA